MSEFPSDLDFKKTNFRKHPELYRVGRGEQGVLKVEPYKSEILPFWTFASAAVAKISAHEIYKLFVKYKEQGDFVGMDMARKYLQMGFTRSRRDENHPSGRKYKPGTREELPRGNDQEKAAAAKIFYAVYLRVREDPTYKKMKVEFESAYN